MPAASPTFRQPQLLRPENFATTSKDHFDEMREPVQNKRLRVTFRPHVNVRPIRHINNMSEEVVEKVWFSRVNFEEMKKEYAQTVKMIAYDIYKGDDEQHCARGLEYRLRPGALIRRANKLNGLEAVLNEQANQNRLGIINDERIAKAFRRENIRCRLSALQMGVRDEVEAKIVHEEEEKKQRKKKAVGFARRKGKKQGSKGALEHIFLSTDETGFAIIYKSDKSKPSSP